MIFTISISTYTLEGIDGLDVCEIVLTRGHVIKEGFRGITLACISMNLKFNNPFCHFDGIVKMVSHINDIYCEDPHPYDRPKPDFEEVRKIVMYNYTRFLAGEHDFSSVIRKKTKNGGVSRKYVFLSRQHITTNTKTKLQRLQKPFMKEEMQGRRLSSQKQ